MYLPFNDGKWATFVSYCFAIPVPCHLWLRIATCIAFKQHLFSSNYCSILQGLVKFWCYGGKKTSEYCCPVSHRPKEQVNLTL